jgi:hypothetical protein
MKARSPEQGPCLQPRSQLAEVLGLAEVHHAVGASGSVPRGVAIDGGAAGLGGWPPIRRSHRPSRGRRAATRRGRRGRWRGRASGARVGPRTRAPLAMPRRSASSMSSAKVSRSTARIATRPAASARTTAPSTAMRGRPRRQEIGEPWASERAPIGGCLGGGLRGSRGRRRGREAELGSAPSSRVKARWTSSTAEVAGSMTVRPRLWPRPATLASRIQPSGDVR